MKAHGKKIKPIGDVKVGDLIILAVIDTGCTQTLVRLDLISTQIGKPETPVSMVCIHGVSYSYDRKRLRQSVMGHTEEIANGLADTLPCLLLLVWPFLKALLGQAMRNLNEEGFKDQQERGFVGVMPKDAN